MADLQTVVADNREAVSAFLAAARTIPPSQWTQPRAPGKWSPAQVTEHVALAYELSRGILHGSFPARSAPRLLRPLIRILFLNPILKNGRFGPGGKSPKTFQPTPSPAPPAALTARLQGASDGLEADLAAAARTGPSTVDHPFFGHVPLPEYLRLQAIHTRHHRQQLPGSPDIKFEVQQ
jgi:hypothetical protein